MQLPAQQTSLEPHPHREDAVGRRPFVSQNTQGMTAADSRAIPTESNARESLRPSDSQGGSKQVAESVAVTHRAAP